MSDGGWHLDRRVSVGHIVTTLAVSAAAMVWMMRLESGVLLNDRAILAQRERLDWVERAIKEDQAEIKQTLRRIWDTLRRVEEKVGSKAERR